MTVMTRNALPQNVSERTRALLTQLNVYYAGVAVLGLVNLYLLIHIGLCVAGGEQPECGGGGSSRRWR